MYCKCGHPQKHHLQDKEECNFNNCSCSAFAPMTVANLIKAIDRRVGRIHAKLRKLETINLMSAESWQAAWDKHPDLYQKERALYRQRGELQKAL